jgi:hypothetical protein
MKELTQWWQEIGGASKPWLLLGKGPTFERRGEFDLSPYFSVALNHVIRTVDADVASAIDLDVVRECGDDILKRARYLLMPRYPHVNFQATDRALDSFLSEIPVLKQLSDEGRLVWYNLSGANAAEGSPIIRGGYFSAEIIVTLLAQQGAKTIRSLGVDGGTNYASEFNDLNQRTKLANGVQSFDKQLAGISRAIWKQGIDYAPLTTEAPVRVFIGADISQMLGAKMLEYSVRQNCAVTAQFDTMQSVQVPMPKDPKNQPRTQFSFNRFAIPQLAGYKGRAVYVDADMQVFRNFQELWDIPFGDAKVLYAPTSDPRRPSQFSVLLLDCQRLDWDVKEIVRGLDEGRYDYDKLMKELCIVPKEQVQDKIPPQWNSLELYEPGKTGLIHYTDMHTQPWVNARNKNGHLWVRCLRDAVHEGFITMAEVEQGVRDGFARPSLLLQMKIPGKVWPAVGPAFKILARLMDLRYKPHRALQTRLAGQKPTP